MDEQAWSTEFFGSASGKFGIDGVSVVVGDNGGSPIGDNGSSTS